MATTQVYANGDGTTINFSFNFPYLKTEDIKVELQEINPNGRFISSVVVTDFTVPTNNPTQIQFNTLSASTNYQTILGAPLANHAVNPANTIRVRIYRETNDNTVPSTFFSGSSVRAQDLNNNFDQNLYLYQELENEAVKANGGTVTGNIIFDQVVTINKAPSEDTDAVNLAYLEQFVGGDSSTVNTTRYREIATQGQTTVTVSPTFAVGNEVVFINGVGLSKFIEYSTPDGSTIIFTTALRAGDVIDVISYNNLLVVSGDASFDEPPFSRNAFIAAANQTAFVCAEEYTVGKEQVFLNGALLKRNVDYTAQDKVNVTLTVAALVGDLVEVHSGNYFASGLTSASNSAYTYPGGVEQTVQQRLEQYVSTADFGCSQDGGTNDLNKLKAAIAEAKVTNKALAIIGTVYFDGEFDDLTDFYKISYRNGGSLRDTNNTTVSFDNVSTEFSVTVNTVNDFLDALDFARRINIISGGHFKINVAAGVYNFTDTVTILAKPGVSILGAVPSAAQTSHQITNVVYQGDSSYNSYTRMYKYSVTISVSDASDFAVGNFISIKKLGVDDIQLNGTLYGGWEITGVSGNNITFDWYYPANSAPGFTQNVDEPSYVCPIKTVFEFPTGMTAIHSMGSYQSTDYNFIFTMKDLAIFTPEVNETGSTDVFGLIADYGSSVGFNGSGDATAMIFSGFRRGIYALNNSTIRASGITASNNGTGIFAQGMCSINAIRSYLTSNRYGTSLGYGANLTVTGSHIYSSGSSGINVGNLSMVVADTSYIRYSIYSNVYATDKSLVSCKSAFLRQLVPTALNVYTLNNSLADYSNSELTGGKFWCQYSSLATIDGTTFNSVDGGDDVQVFKGKIREYQTNSVVAAASLTAGQSTAYSIPFEGITASAVGVIYLANCNSTLPSGVVVDVRCVTTDELQLTLTNTTSSTVGAFTRTWTFVILDYRA